MTTPSPTTEADRRPVLRPPGPELHRTDVPRRPLLQLELPLAEGERQRPGSRPSGTDDRSGDGHDWRLGEDARQSGRAGIAAARAILARTARAA